MSGSVGTSGQDLGGEPWVPCTQLHPHATKFTQNIRAAMILKNLILTARLLFLKLGPSRTTFVKAGRKDYNLLWSLKHIEMKLLKIFNSLKEAKCSFQGPSESFQYFLEDVQSWVPLS